MSENPICPPGRPRLVLDFNILQNSYIQENKQKETKNEQDY